MSKERKYPEDIGSCEIREGEEPRIEKAFWGQGYMFKSSEAYHNRPQAPCYVPELSDSVYTAEDFLHICNDQKEFADELFEEVDWQHPETLMEDWMRNEEWVVCEGCGKLVDFGDGCNDKKCPSCGAEVGDE